MDAETFMRIHALKAMTGALAATVIDLTPDASAQALALGERGLPRTRDVRMRRLPGVGDPVFEVTYADGARSVTLRETVRELNGEWKITRIEPARGRSSTTT
jgi:hypothetical protein